MRETMDVVRQSTADIALSVRHLEESSASVLEDTVKVHDSTSRINQNSLVIAQSSIKQLKLTERMVAEADGAALDGEPISVPILVLQHSAWVARVRAVLDGELRLAAREVQDHHACDLGKWYDAGGKVKVQEAKADADFSRHHERLHELARSIVSLHEAGKTDEAEAMFPELVGQSEAMITLLGGLASVLRSGAQRTIIMNWEPRFAVNHPKIDAQHQELIRLINALYEGLMLGRGKAVTGEILDRLVDYTQTHFRDEEALFAASAYPSTDAHKREHQAFVAKVGELMANLKSGKVVLGSDTLVFLKDWLTGHILGTDKGYAKYLK
jgi:hemerythrin-like metal-binding protein